VLIDANDPHSGQPVGPVAATNAAVALIAIVFRVCLETPSSTSIAETVVCGQLSTAATHTGRTAASWLIGAASLPRS
jgi:hypothetical protein